MTEVRTQGFPHTAYCHTSVLALVNCRLSSREVTPVADHGLTIILVYVRHRLKRSVQGEGGDWFRDLPFLLSMKRFDRPGLSRGIERHGQLDGGSRTESRIVEAHPASRFFFRDEQRRPFLKEGSSLAIYKRDYFLH